MAVDAGTIFSEVRIALDKLTGDVKSVNTKMDQIVKKSEETAKKSQTGFKKFFSFIRKSGVASFLALGFAIAKVSKFLKESIKAASDAQEVYSKFDTVFESIQQSASETADAFAESFGIAGSTARELLSATGDLLVGFGATEQQALDLSEEVNTLAADLASFTNIQGGTARASQALTKALLGERESAKLLGIVIRETDVSQKLMEKGQKDLTGQALLLAKAQATLEIATEQSQKALGDYERTADSAANVEKRLQETNKELEEQIGKSFIPIVTAVRLKLIEWKDAIAEVIRESNKLRDVDKDIDEGTATIADRIEKFEILLKREKENLEFLESEENINKRLNAFEVQAAQSRIVNFNEQLALLERLASSEARFLQAQADNDAKAEASAKEEEERTLAAIADTQLRIKVEEDLRNALFAIDQQAQLAIETGEEFNIELEKQKAVQSALNELFGEQFRLAGPGVQGLIDRYGEWLTVIEGVSLTEEELALTLENTNIKANAGTGQRIEAVEEEKASLEELILLYSGPLTETISAFSSLFQVGNNNEIQALDAKIQAIRDLADIEQGEAESNEEFAIRKKAALVEEKAAIEKLEARKKELILENFQLNKAFQAANTVINTATAIVAALTSTPPNVPLSIFAGLTGAAQLATIAATQPPALQTGGIVLPQSGGRLVNMAENGSPELALNSGASGAPLMKMFAQQIAAEMGGGGGQIFYLTLPNGQILAEAVAPVFNNGNVKLNFQPRES